MAESEAAPSVKDLLKGLGESVRDDFTRNRRVLSYAEYLQLVVAEPFGPCKRMSLFGRPSCTNDRITP